MKIYYLLEWKTCSSGLSLSNKQLSHMCAVRLEWCFVSRQSTFILTWGGVSPFVLPAQLSFAIFWHPLATRSLATYFAPFATPPPHHPPRNIQGLILSPECFKDWRTFCSSLFVPSRVVKYTHPIHSRLPMLLCKIFNWHMPRRTTPKQTCHLFCPQNGTTSCVHPKQMENLFWCICTILYVWF